jgi:hypothetical protein
MGIKLVELFANRVDERRNMINGYLRGEVALRVLGRVLILSFSCSSELCLALLCHVT